MSSWTTNTLARTIEYVQCFCQLRPLTGVGNNTNFPLEPALSMADWVLQTMLGPPYAWRWNRAEATSIALTQAAGQDYIASIANFGWIERAMIYGDTDCPAKELVIRNSLAVDETQDEPSFISVQEDNNSGSITFRVLPAPYANYTLLITYQMAAPLFTATTQSWAPIPDYLSYIYNTGFLAKAYEQKGDEKFPVTMQQFFQFLAAASQGLDREQASIVVRNSLADLGGAVNRPPQESVRYNIAERG